MTKLTLQEQMLKAGLVSSKKMAKVQRTAKKSRVQAREAREAVEENKKAQVERDKQLSEQQKQAAEVEVAKPFAQEEELAEKSARLAELNALLNIDRDRSSSQDAPEETEETEAPATRPSVLSALEEKANQPEPVKPFKSYLDKEGR